MNLSQKHQQGEEQNLFGMLGARAIFQQAQERFGRRHDTPRDAVQEVKGVIEENKKLRNDIYRTATILRRMTNEYNKKYREDLTFDRMNLAASLKNINESLKKTKSKEKKAILIEMALILHDTIKMQKRLDKIDKTPSERDELAHRQEFRRSIEPVLDGREALKSWKKGSYESIKDRYDELASKPAFESLWETTSGIEKSKNTEMRQLFMAILAKNTDGFKNMNVFGDRFGEDVEENIRNFPHLYHIWYEKEHGAGAAMEKLLEAENRATAEQERVNQLGRTLEQMIAIAGPATGMRVDDISSISKTPEDAYWSQLADLLTDYIHNLNSKHDEYVKSGNPTAAKDYPRFVEELKVHIEYSNAESHYHALRRSQIEESKNFKASYFRKEQNHDLAVELAMLKFKKAVDMTDNPLRSLEMRGDWKPNYHPTVRRMVISHFFENGVSAYKKNLKGEVSYREDIGADKAKMLAALNKSDYFNATERGRFMDREHRVGLVIADFAFSVVDFMQNTEVAGDVMTKIIAAKEQHAAGNTDAYERMIKAIDADPNLVQKYLRFRLPELRDRQKLYQLERKNLATYLTMAQAFLENPYSPAAKKAIREFEKAGIGKALQSNIDGIADIALMDAPRLAIADASLAETNINYNAIVGSEKGDLEFFRQIGMRIENLHKNYEAALAKYPDMTVDNWRKALFSRDKAEFARLVKFLDLMIPPSNKTGKAHFIQTLWSMRKIEDVGAYMTSPELASDHAHALAVLNMLHGHIKAREGIAGESAAKQAQIEKAHAGFHVGDFVEEIGLDVWDRLTDPGESWVNRGAAFIALYAAYKAARKAMKGDGPAGKALRIAFLGLAAEVITKNLTGEGVLDRMGIDLLEARMEGTYESVLIDEGKEHMEAEGITDKEHELALQNMRQVPFHVLMEWYDQTSSSGKLLKPQGKREFKLPKGIDVDYIVKKSFTPENKEVRASLILKHAMKNFFTYVGNKDNNAGYEHGLRITRERWYSLIKNPGKATDQSDFKLLARGLPKDRQKITWQYVTEAEIDVEDVKRLKGTTLAGKAEQLVTEAWGDVGEWVDYHKGKITGYANIFFERLAPSAARRTRELADGLLKKGAEKIHFTKESIKIWYEGHEFELRKMAEMHWDLIATGATLPFQMALKVDEMVVPYVLSKLKQMSEIMAMGEESIMTGHSELLESDIFVIPPHLPPDQQNEAFVLGNPNYHTNPAYHKFGEFQAPILAAFRAGPRTPEAYRDGERFHEDASHIGYNITRMSVEDAGINMDKVEYKNNPQAVQDKLYKKSREAALRHYKNKLGSTMAASEIDKYMYPIHKMTGADNRSMFVFWRLPMPGSLELYLRQSGKFTDYQDPRRFMDRENGPFILDQDETKMKNFIDALMLDMEGPRGIAQKSLAILAQLPRMGFAATEAVGRPTAYIIARILDRNDRNGVLSPRGQDIENQILTLFVRPQDTKMLLDEATTSAGNSSLAISEFYKNRLNANLFKLSLDYSTRNGLPKYTGLLSGQNGYNQNSLFNQKKPSRTYYRDMLLYYDQLWSDENPGHEAGVRAILAREAAAER
ncbi:MAG: hypothetical protein OEY44_01130 [Candidatus Peregrinibacteria bacterium]|nr:hypothetical protein [Candidatus Peregrinibacteria bacterium]